MRNILFLSLILLFSCSQGESNESLEQPRLTDEITDTITADAVETTEEHTDSISTNAILLETGFYHGDEVSDAVDQMKWWGLLKNSSGELFVKPTTIYTEAVYDPILDEEGEKSGKNVVCDSKDSVILLINGLDFIKEHRLSEQRFENGELAPGCELSFSHAGWNYKLYAEAEVEEKEYYTSISKYALRLDISNAKSSSSQLIAEADFFDDAMMQLLFVGDIDGDGILDFFIDTSHKYSYTQPTLFLSYPASEDEIVVEVASGIAVGC